MKKDLNRQNQPDLTTIKKISLTNPDKIYIDNGIPVYILDAGTQDILKIDLIFNAGTYFQNKPLIALSTNKMLIEGTQNSTAYEIAEKLDYYGAHLETIPGKDHASITLYLLNKYLEKLLPVLAEIINKPVFPEKELKTFIKKAKQEFIINNEKVKYLAKINFDKIIFGNKNQYGRIADLKDFDNLERNFLIDFYKKYYTTKNCKIIVSGKINNKTIPLLNKLLGSNKQNAGYTEQSKPYKIEANAAHKHFIKKEDALQTAISIGKPLFNKKHPDFIPLQILNTVLGGYFGSRLMSNIREDKGYTYGIGSALISLQNSGYFYIATEAGTHVSKNAINEIYKEIKLLCDELIPQAELNLVKNFMLGSFLRTIDGPFALSEMFKSVLEYDMDFTYYDKYLNIINSITSENLIQLAKKYFTKETMFELLVGK